MLNTSFTQQLRAVKHALKFPHAISVRISSQAVARFRPSKIGGMQLPDWGELINQAEWFLAYVDRRRICCSGDPYQRVTHAQRSCIHQR